MSPLIRAAQTLQTLSLAAMEEASREGRREADLEHLVIALALGDGPGGTALRRAGLTHDRVRAAVRRMREDELASLGVRAPVPEPGRITFHETSGYDWSRRARELLDRATRGTSGDDAAVLRTLLSEPSGLIADILRRGDSSADAVLRELDALAGDAPGGSDRRRRAGAVSTFVPAEPHDVWTLLVDPVRRPDWDFGTSEVHDGATGGAARTAAEGVAWVTALPERRPDGKRVRVKPAYRRRRIEFLRVEAPTTIRWRAVFPDAPRANPLTAEVTVVPAEGGSTVTVALAWRRRTGWRRAVGLPLRPLQRFVTWLTAWQLGAGIARCFR